MEKLVIAVALLVLGTTAPADAQISKCINDEGKTYFTNMSCPLGSAQGKSWAESKVNPTSIKQPARKRSYTDCVTEFMNGADTNSAEAFFILNREAKALCDGEFGYR